MRTVAAALAVLLLGQGLSAQEPRAAESIEVSIVNVDVVVTDAKGKRVTGLTASDFEIREGGKVQPISNFAEYSSAAVPQAGVTGVDAAAAQPTPAPRAPRTIVVFIEREPKTPPFRARQIFDAIRGMLRATVAKGDRVMLVRWTGRATIRQPFTDDLETLDSVLAEIEREQQQVGIDEAGGVLAEQAASDQAAYDAATALPGGGSMDPNSAEAIAAREAADALGVSKMDFAKRQYAAIRAKGLALEALVHGISASEGRKIVIMAMRRFGTFAGAEAFQGGSVDFDRRSELRTDEITESLIRTANANNVTLYSLYLPGRKWEGVKVEASGDDIEGDLAAGALQPNVAINEALNLEFVATSTGGLAAVGSEEIARMLPRVADDLENYYSLAYRGKSSAKDATRKVEVRTKNRQYTVRSRTQVVQKSDETRIKDRLIANLMQQLETPAIPFEVTLGELKPAGRNRWELPLKVRIPIRSLTTLPQGDQEAGAFSVYAVTGGSLGVTSEVQHRTQPFQIPRSDLERARASHFTYDLALTVDQKADRISIGVVDETSKESGVKQLTFPAGR